jgi:hypothetical protein
VSAVSAVGTVLAQYSDDDADYWVGYTLGCSEGATSILLALHR